MPRERYYSGFPAHYTVNLPRSGTLVKLFPVQGLARDAGENDHRGLG